MKECLDAIRSIQLAAMAICAALLVMGSSPILSRQYETAVGALDKIPEVPQTEHFRKAILAAVDTANERKSHLAEILAAAWGRFGKRLSDDQNNLGGIWFSINAQNTPFPQTDRLDAFTKFLDYLIYTATPTPAAVLFTSKLQNNIPSECQPCTILSAQAVETPRKEYFDVIVQLKTPSGGARQLRLKDVEGSSDLQAAVEAIWTMLLTGDSDLHENDYRVTKPWWTYLSTKLRSDLAPVWQEVRFMSRREAIKEMEDRALHTNDNIAFRRGD
jgi:hypothetical protein